MHRWLGVALVLSAATPAAADITELGAWIGPRTFSSDSKLGLIADAPAHPQLQNTIAFGARVARPFLPWLVPELELALAPTETDAVGGADAASVLWLDPRIHLRFELMPGRRIQPFVVVGGSAPIVLSSARKTFNSGITGDGYAGGGIRFDSGRGFVIRFDARVALQPGGANHFRDPDAADSILATEVDIGIGIELALGAARRPTPRIETGPEDRDHDGLADAADKCPDRAEDHDDFEDGDGCPDIDNDLDRVLDVADKCPLVGEAYNGFDDGDGCPDTVPASIDAIRGTIEGLIYAEGETLVRASARKSIDKLAKLMTAQPTIRIVLIGHTDDREAKQFANGQDDADLAALSADLARARAEATRQALVAVGVPASRIDIEGHGFDEPVADNDTPRGRLANRRVEVKLYVPASAPRQ